MKIIKIIFLSVLVLFFAACGGEDDFKVDQGFKVGEEITFKSVMGSSITLIRTEKGFVQKGKEKNVLLIDIFGTFCEPCKKEAPHLMDLQLKNADDLTIIAFSHLEDVTDEYIVNQFSSKYNAYYFIINDERTSKIVNTITKDIGYKQAVRVPTKVMLKNGEYQNIKDVWDGNLNNKVYLGETPINVIEEDLKRIKSL